MKASAYSPSHITGLFEICDSNPDPLRKGSRGAGVCLEKGVWTEVELKEGKGNTLIKINGEVSDAPVSRAVIGEYERLGLIRKSINIVAKHRSDLPIGGGFGISGAGALSLSLALNKVLGLGLSYVETAQIAHIADLLCKTGLGTVMAETVGGFELRTSPGAPGVGRAGNFSRPHEHAVVSLFLNSLQTKDYLSDPVIRRKVNEASLDGITSMIANPTVENFLKESSNFSKSLGFTTPRMAGIIDEASQRGFTCSMAMFGETVFTAVHESEVKEVARIFSRDGEKARGRIIVSRVAKEVAHLI